MSKSASAILSGSHPPLRHLHRKMLDFYELLQLFVQEEESAAEGSSDDNNEKKPSFPFMEEWIGAVDVEAELSESSGENATSNGEQDEELKELRQTCAELQDQRRAEEAALSELNSSLQQMLQDSSISSSERAQRTEEASEMQKELLVKRLARLTATRELESRLRVIKFHREADTILDEGENEKTTNDEESSSMGTHHSDSSDRQVVRSALGILCRLFLFVRHELMERRGARKEPNAAPRWIGQKSTTLWGIGQTALSQEKQSLKLDPTAKLKALDLVLWPRDADALQKIAEKAAKESEKLVEQLKRDQEDKLQQQLQALAQATQTTTDTRQQASASNAPSSSVTRHTASTATATNAPERKTDHAERRITPTTTDSSGGGRPPKPSSRGTAPQSTLVLVDAAEMFKNFETVPPSLNETQSLGIVSRPASRELQGGTALPTRESGDSVARTPIQASKQVFEFDVESSRQQNNSPTPASSRAASGGASRNSSSHPRRPPSTAGSLGAISSTHETNHFPLLSATPAVQLADRREVSCKQSPPRLSTPAQPFGNPELVGARHVGQTEAELADHLLHQRRRMTEQGRDAILASRAGETRERASSSSNSRPFKKVAVHETGDPDIEGSTRQYNETDASSQNRASPSHVSPSSGTSTALVVADSRFAQTIKALKQKHRDEVAATVVGPVAQNDIPIAKAGAKGMPKPLPQLQLETSAIAASIFNMTATIVQEQEDRPRINNQSNFKNKGAMRGASSTLPMMAQRAQRAKRYAENDGDDDRADDEHHLMRRSPSPNEGFLPPRFDEDTDWNLESPKVLQHSAVDDGDRRSPVLMTSFHNQRQAEHDTVPLPSSYMRVVSSDRSGALSVGELPVGTVVGFMPRPQKRWKSTPIGVSGNPTNRRPVAVTPDPSNTAPLARAMSRQQSRQSNQQQQQHGAVASIDAILGNEDKLVGRRRDEDGPQLRQGKPRYQFLQQR